MKREKPFLITLPVRVQRMSENDWGTPAGPQKSKEVSVVIFGTDSADALGYLEQRLYDLFGPGSEDV